MYFPIYRYQTSVHGKHPYHQWHTCSLRLNIPTWYFSYPGSPATSSICVLMQLQSVVAFQPLENYSPPWASTPVILTSLSTCHKSGYKFWQRDQTNVQNISLEAQFCFILVQCFHFLHSLLSCSNGL